MSTVDQKKYEAALKTLGVSTDKLPSSGNMERELKTRQRSEISKARRMEGGDSSGGTIKTDGSHDTPSHTRQATVNQAHAYASNPENTKQYRHNRAVQRAAERRVLNAERARERVASAHQERSRAQTSAGGAYAFTQTPPRAEQFVWDRPRSFDQILSDLNRPSFFDLEAHNRAQGQLFTALEKDPSLASRVIGETSGIFLNDLSGKLRSKLISLQPEAFADKVWSAHMDAIAVPAFFDQARHNKTQQRIAELLVAVPDLASRLRSDLSRMNLDLASMPTLSEALSNAESNIAGRPPRHTAGGAGNARVKAQKALNL